MILALAKGDKWNMPLPLTSCGNTSFSLLICSIELLVLSALLVVVVGIVFVVDGVVVEEAVGSESLRLISSLHLIPKLALDQTLSLK